MKVRLYGYLQEKHHLKELELPLNNEITITELATKLSRDHNIDVSILRFAVNNEFVKGTFRLNNDSVVDLIPPVAGG